MTEHKSFVAWFWINCKFLQQKFAATLAANEKLMFEKPYKLIVESLDVLFKNVLRNLLLKTMLLTSHLLYLQDLF